MSRFLTHLKRLLDPEEPVHRFLERAEEVGSKLGPILIQLPPALEADLDRLDRTLRLFPAGVRVAVEVRHASWYSDGLRRLLERHDAALCWADRGRPLDPTWRTAAWGFVRFHEGRAHPRPCYGRRALATWAERLAGAFQPDEDVFAYFNNDHRCCAVRDAVVLARLAAKAGLRPTRVPAPDSVAVSGQAS